PNSLDPGDDAVLILSRKPPAARRPLSCKILQSEPHAASAIERAADPVLDVPPGLKDAVQGGAAIPSQSDRHRLEIKVSSFEEKGRPLHGYCPNWPFGTAGAVLIVCPGYFSSFAGANCLILRATRLGKSRAMGGECKSCRTQGQAHAHDTPQLSNSFRRLRQR